MGHTAYFDESGIHAGSEITVVAGFLADDDNAWRDFAAKWNEILQEFELSKFHSVDCEHGQGEFCGKHPEPIRKFILMEFARLIASSGLTIIASAFVIDDWRMPQEHPLSRRFPNAYMFCFEYCMQKLSRWGKHDPARGKVNIVFAEQKQYESKALEMFGHYARSEFFGGGLGLATYAPMKGCAGLQAADILCNETYKRGRAGPNAPLTPAMECMLSSATAPMAGYFDAGSFQMLIENGPSGRLF